MQRRTIVCLLATIVLLVSGSVLADEGLTIIGSAFNGQPFHLEGDRFLEGDPAHAMLRDYSPDGDPTWLSHLYISEHTLADVLCYEDGTLAVLPTLIDGGFSLYDLSDPTQPLVRSQVTGPFYQSLQLHGDALYLDAINYVATYDISDRDNPLFSSLVPVNDHEGTRHLTVFGDRLLFVDRFADLRSFDLTDPLQPADQGVVSLGGLGVDALMAGDGVLYAVLHTEAAGDVIIDLATFLPSSGTSWSQTSRINLATGPDAQFLAADLDDDLLLVSLEDDQVLAFDCSAPTSPSAGYTLDQRATTIQISDNLVVLDDQLAATFYRRTTAHQAPELLSVKNRLPDTRQILGRPPVILAYKPLQTKVYPIDVSRPHDPSVLAPVELSDGGRLNSNGDLMTLIRTTDSNIELYDIADAQNPVSLSVIETDAPSISFVVFGDELLAYDEFGVTLCDIADPTDPKVGGSINAYSPVAMDGRRLVVLAPGGLDLYDVSDPTAPSYQSRLPYLEGVFGDVAFAGDIIYFSPQDHEGDSDIRMFDISDPTTPVEIGTFPTLNYSRTLHVHESRLYVIHHSSVDLYDIADPTSPLLVASANSYGFSNRSIVCQDDLTFLSAWATCMRDEGFSGTTDVPGTESLLGHLHPAYPNPFNPSTTLSFDVPRAGRYQLTIHDARGRRVATLVDDELSAGPHQRTWTGLTSQGRPAASGIYLVRLSGNGVESHRTVTLVK